MASSSYDLQVALRALLLADADVSAAVGDRIYDGAPVDAAYPYITFGPSFTVPDDAGCIGGVTETVQVDIWSTNQAKMWPCKEIVAAVRRALHEASISLTTHAEAGCRVPLTRTMLDPDGITAHGVVQVEVMLEEN